MNGFISNGKDDFDGNQQTFPKLLQAAGYQTAIIGKWHLGSVPTGFDYWDILPGQGHYYNPDFINEKGACREEGYVSEIITRKALGWLKGQEESSQPFMLMIHHKAPHREWSPAGKYLGCFDGIEFPEPETLFDDYQGRGTAAKEQDMTIDKTMLLASDLKMWSDTISARWKNTIGRMTPEQRAVWDAFYNPVIAYFENAGLEGKEMVRWKYQRYLTDYLACIKSVDESVGEVLDYLKASGLDKNTIVVYTSDQGFFLGEHGWFDKRFMFEESYRTPLVVSWPGVVSPGTVDSHMVSNIDFAPTLLEAAGVEVPEDMQGESMVALLKGDDSVEWRQEHYYHYYEYPGWHSVKRHYGIATDRYKLMHFYYNIDEWEMYDLQVDPLELTNVYNDPEYKEVRDELHKKLEELRGKYKDSEELTRSFLPAEAM